MVPSLSPTCDELRSETFAACDGELTAAEVAALDRHLAGCDACRARLTADATFHRAVRNAVSLDTAPAALRERIALLLLAPATENVST